MKAFDQKIEQLLQEKTFDQLTKEQQQYVRAHLSQAEYEALQWTVAKSQSLFRQYKTTPDPAVKTRLQTALQNRKPDRSPLALLLTLLQFRIPAYQVALGVCCLLFGWWLFQSPTATPLPEQVIVYQTDTIYKEIPQAITVAARPTANHPKKTTAKRAKKQQRSAPKTNSEARQKPTAKRAKVNQAPKKTEAIIPENLIIVPQKLVVEKIAGRSLKADADLLVFLDEVRSSHK